MQILMTFSVFHPAFHPHTLKSTYEFDYKIKKISYYLVGDYYIVYVEP